MPADFTFSETYGDAPGTTVDSSYVHLLSSDVASGGETNHLAFPIVIPTGAAISYSFERWIRGHWTGVFTTISNVRFYKSDGIVPSGDTLRAGDRGSQTYAKPVATSSLIAASPIPTALAGALSLGYSGGFSDYVVLQVAMNSTRGTGESGLMTYRFEWDEV